MRAGFPGFMGAGIQAGKFLPSDLAGGVLWLKSNDSSTITQASGSVSQWNDRFGNGNNVTQGVGVQQPTTNATTENGHNVIDFDGGDDLIVPSALHSIPNGPSTTFCVAKRTSEDASVDTIVGMASGASNNFFIIFAGAAGTISFKNRAGVGIVSSTGSTNTNFNIIACRRSGTTQGISVNGESENTNTNGLNVADIDDAFVGQAGSETLELTGNIAEIIMYDRSLVAAEIVKVNRYLSIEWGITLA